MLQILESKIKQQIQRLERQEGAVWMHTNMGQRLAKRLEEIQATKAKMAA